MNAVDIAVVVILIASGVFALIRGFIHEILAMAGWILAPLAAFWGLPIVRPLMQKFISRPVLADYAGGALIFIAVLILASIVTHAIAKSVQKSAISGVDRSLGFVFGLARGLLACSLGYMVVVLLIPQEPDVLTSARTRPLLVWGSDAIQAVIPSHVAELGDKAKELTERGRQAVQAKDNFDALIAPQPRAAEPSTNDNKAPNYDQQGLERLIQNTNGK